MNILCLIPARLGSSRFPGKPLAPILGKAMIQHVYERCASSPLLSETVVATCDDEIAEHITNIGGKAVLTSDRHERASDRCAEALLKVEQEKNIKYDLVVMVQGDEPLVTPKMIEESIQPLISNENIKVTNLRCKIKDQSDFTNINTIKVAIDLQGFALYFSRSPIPYIDPKLDLEGFDLFGWKQVCVIPFRRDFLLEYTNTQPTANEVRESVDMMRILDSGGQVYMAETKASSHPVDVPNDIIIVENIMLNKG